MNSKGEKSMRDAFREEAYPLVTFNSNSNSFDVNEECRDFLSKLDAPVGVISVAGMYRTGKSYLLNRMLLNRKRGFDVGPTINACTKGVWIWGQPIDGFTPDGDPIKVLVLDTEGLGALDEDSNHDVRIFSLAILLGSYFIYNSVGSIDENALSQLSLVINLTKNIQIKAGKINDEIDPEEYAQYFPSFMWVVRDFTLQLLDSEQEPITPKEYLEKALSNQKGFSEAVEQKNRIRKLLKSFFKERDCCTMIRPLTQESQLQNLVEMEMESLRAEFVEQVHTLRRKVINRIKPKTINGRPLNGEMLFNLASSYATAINNGAVPSIENSWSYICKNECLKAVATSFAEFERLFYEWFQDQVPMQEEELKRIFKQAKNTALEIFNKTAVGEVKEEFLTQLKKNMRQKFSHFSLENEKSSESQCMLFLQANYEPIAQKLSNNEYERLDALSREIKDFLMYYMDEGPSGPYKQIIGQEFAYKALAEGSDFFFKSTTNELHIQQQLAEQSSKKLKSEIAEIKEERRKDGENFENKMRVLQVEKAELLAKEQTVRENYAQLQKDKARLEQEYEERAALLKKEASAEVDSMRTKMQSAENAQKETQRQQMATESDFLKQKALLEQQIEFLEKRNQALDAKEKELAEELKQQKKEAHGSSTELKTKFEQQLRELQKKLEEQKDSLFDWESKYQSLGQNFEHETAKWTDLEGTLKKELAKIKESNITLTTQNESLKKQLEKELQANNQREQEDSQLKEERLVELETCLKEVEEENDSLKSKYEKDSAINQQKLEFLQVQLDQERAAREEQKKNHERMIRSINNNARESVIGKEEANKKVDELKEKFQQEYQQLQVTYDKSLSSKETELNSMTENCQKIELELQLSTADFRKQTDLLREQLSQSEEERKKLSKYNQSADANSQNLIESTKERFEQQIEQLEAELDEKEREHEESLQSIHQQSEEQLGQLKNFYESEKQRLEDRFHQEKERAVNRYNTMVEEHEAKAREDQANHEYDLEMLQNELTAVTEEHKQYVSHYENELNLRHQQIDALEKYLAETKESLSNMQALHQQQQDQMEAKLLAERRDLLAKVESLTQEMTRKERSCTTLENQKEALVVQLSQKEKQLQTLKEELVSEKNEIAEKLVEARSRLEDKEDELTQRKIDFERERALKDQQIMFTEQKSNDLSSQLERTSQRYEERIKLDREEMQRDLKEKSQRLQSEKDHAEARYEAKRKAFKDLENRLSKESANQEREKAVLLLKFQNLETQQAQLIENYKTELGRARDTIDQLQSALEGDKVAISQELELQRRQCIEMERQLQDQINNYDKDKALWEGKFTFLEQQRDQSKRDLDEGQSRFQQYVEQLKQAQHDSKNKTDMTHSQMMEQMEGKFQQRVKELQEHSQQALTEANMKIKSLEREKSSLLERLELTSRDQMSESGNMSKKLEKQLELNERLSSELETIKADREKKVNELTQRFEKERETLNQKKRDAEMKATRTESKQTELLLSHEREKAKWDMQLTEVYHQKEDFKSEVERLKLKVDSQVKEVERLRYELRNQRKNFQTAAQNSSSIGAAMVGASLVGKLNLPRPGGYQPMHSANNRNLDDPEGSGTDRSQDLKQGLRGSVNFSKNFLTQSLASNFASKLKEGPMQETQDTSMQKANLLSTPNSKISDEHDNDMPNMAGKDSPTQN